MRERQQAEAVTGVLLTGMQLGIAGVRIKDLHQRWKGGGEERRLEKEER